MQGAIAFPNNWVTSTRTRRQTGEIAASVLFLMSDDPAFIAGQSLISCPFIIANIELFDCRPGESHSCTIEVAELPTASR